MARQDVCVGSQGLSDRPWSTAHTVPLAPAALWPVIRALLYRLLIISAHLQRHGIRLLIAIGRFNARAPSVPIRRHLLIADSRAPLRPPSLLSPPLASSRLLAPRNRQRCPSSAGTHYNYRQGPRASAVCENTTRETASPRDVRFEDRTSRIDRDRSSRKSRSVNRVASPRPNRGRSDSGKQSEIAARLIKSELHSTGVYTPTGVRWGSTSITARSTVGRM